MNFKIIIIFGICFSLSPATLLNAQTLKAGFEPVEALEALRVSARFGDSAYLAEVGESSDYRLVYRSESMGLDNMWELMSNDRGTMMLNVRGSTKSPESWLANFYAVMTPARGSIQFSDRPPFHYELAQNEGAAVHSGWLVSLAYLQADILSVLDSVYNLGVRDLILTGHSQGGAIIYLLSAHLSHLQRAEGRYGGMRIKTYCTAAPKPGNLYFAYDFEARMRGGWAFNVVNAADWVPEAPVSIQKLDDFNPGSPFPLIPDMIREQKFPVNLVLKHAYKRMDKPTQRAANRYSNYLGNHIGKRVQGVLPELVLPEESPEFAYVRTGHSVVLMPDEAYYLRFPHSDTAIFRHHFHQPYVHLLMKTYDLVEWAGHPQPGADSSDGAMLSGSWELRYLSGPRIAFDGLYPDRRPIMKLDTERLAVNGFTSCNSFSGNFTMSGKVLQFGQQFGMTRMACPGMGESIFLETLKLIDRWALSDDLWVLTLYKAELPMMAFDRMP